MKYYPLLFTALLALAVSGCNKDIDFEPELPVAEQPFFARGEFYDTFDSIPRTYSYEMQQDEGDLALPGVAFATGANEDYKYGVSILSFDPHIWLYDAPFSNAPGAPDPFINQHSFTIGVRFVSDRPASEYDRPFTKAELEALLQPGSYTFGTAPGQVEISARRLNGELYMINLEPQWEHGYNQLEVLSVEDYEYPGTVSEEPIVGKVVQVRGQTALRYPSNTADRFYYVKLEGKFLFTYE